MEAWLRSGSYRNFKPADLTYIHTGADSARPFRPGYLLNSTPAEYFRLGDRMDLPSSWRNPYVDVPRSSTPVGLVSPVNLGFPSMAFRTCDVVGSHIFCLSWLNSSAHLLAVYASQLGSPQDHAKLASGC